MRTLFSFGRTETAIQFVPDLAGSSMSNTMLRTLSPVSVITKSAENVYAVENQSDNTMLFPGVLLTFKTPPFCEKEPVV